MAKLNLAAGIGIARAPPHQKIGDSYTFDIAGRIKPTPRRLVVRGLLAKIASGEWKDISFAEYEARKISLGKGMLPPVAAVVAGKLGKDYPDTLRKQSQDAFMTKRKTKHAGAAGAIGRGASAAKALGVSVPGL